MGQSILEQLVVSLGLDTSQWKPQVDSALGDTNRLEGGLGSLLHTVEGVAAKLGLGLGLEELARHSLTAFAEIEKIEISMRALTGSAEAAAGAIANIKAQASKFALPDEMVLATQQRFVALGVTLERIPSVIQAIADSSAAWNRDFENVAGAFERVVQTGNAGTKQLFQLGLQMSDLAKVMGVAVGEVKDSFESLNESARAEVLIQALQKYKGMAEEVANSLSGQWQRLKSEAGDLAQEFGRALAPAAKAAMEAISGMAPLLEGLAATIQQVTSTAGGMDRWAVTFAAALAAVGVALTTLRTNAAAASGGLSTFLQTLTIIGGIQLGTGLGQWLLSLTSDYKKAEAEVDKLNKLVAEHGVIIQRGGDDLKTYAAKVFAAWEQIKSGATEAFASMNAVAAGVSKVIETQTNLENAAHDAGEVYRALVQMQKEGAATAADVVRAYNNWRETLKAIGQDLTPLQKAFKTLGLESIDELTKKYNEAVDAYNKVKAAMQGVAGGQAEIDRALLATVEALDKLERAMGSATQTARQFDISGLDEFLDAERVKREAKAWDELQKSMASTGSESDRMKQALDFTKEHASVLLLSDGWQQLDRNVKTVGADFTRLMDEALKASDAFSAQRLSVGVEAAQKAFELLGRSAGTTSTQLQAAWLNWQNAAIDAAQKTGQAIDKDLVGALARQSEAFEANTHAADIWAAKTLDTFHAIDNAVLKFDADMAGAFADMITKGTDFGEAMKNIFLDLANTIIKTLVKGALNDLMGSLGLLHDKTILSMDSLKDWIKIAGGSSSTVVGAAQSVTQAVGTAGQAMGATQAIQEGLSAGGGAVVPSTGGGGGGGLGAASSFLGMSSGLMAGIGLIEQVINDVMSYLQARRMEQDIGRIEVTTRHIENGQADVVNWTHETVMWLQQIHGFYTSTLLPWMAQMSDALVWGVRPDGANVPEYGPGGGGAPNPNATPNPLPTTGENVPTPPGLENIGGGNPLSPTDIWSSTVNSPANVAERVADRTYASLTGLGNAASAAADSIAGPVSSMRTSVDDYVDQQRQAQQEAEETVRQLNQSLRSLHDSADATAISLSADALSNYLGSIRQAYLQASVGPVPQFATANNPEQVASMLPEPEFRTNLKPGTPGFQDEWERYVKAYRLKHPGSGPLGSETNPYLEPPGIYNHEPGGGGQLGPDDVASFMPEPEFRTNARPGTPEYNRAWEAYVRAYQMKHPGHGPLGSPTNPYLVDPATAATRAMLSGISAGGSGVNANQGYGIGGVPPAITTSQGMTEDQMQALINLTRMNQWGYLQYFGHGLSGNEVFGQMPVTPTSATSVPLSIKVDVSGIDGPVRQIIEGLVQDALKQYTRQLQLRGMVQ